jgi:phospholipase C
LKKILAFLPFAFAAALSVGCTSSGAGSTRPNAPVLPTFDQGVPGAAAMRARHRLRRATAWPIQNVVIIVQENRTVDDLFQFLPGANTQSFGLNSSGQTVQLQSQNLAAPYDLGHTHVSWQNEYNGGQMNGFNLESCSGSCPKNPAYTYVPQRQVQPYYTLAETYAFADDMFETDQGPSFPSHQYLVSGTSTVSEDSVNKADDNPQAPHNATSGGCDSPAKTLVQVITPQGATPKDLETYPCFQREALMNELDAAGVTWKYYQDEPGAGLWHGVDPIYSIWSDQREMAANVISPPTQVLTDIENGNLANVVWVTPMPWYSDHPDSNDGDGPSWVAAIVNAIGASSYWQNTAIFITWDDWGGFYDHVTPTIYNSYELGFRVPLVVVSPYAKPGYVSHVQHEFGSILHFVEENFNLPSLGTTDARADDLADCFNFDQPMRKYRKVAANRTAVYFLRLRSIRGGPER